MKRLVCFALLVVGCAHNPSPPLKPVAPEPTPQPKDSRVPFTLHDNRILVDVFLNGQGPFVMIFDVGARSVLTPEVQHILELKSQGMDAEVLNGEQKVRGNTVHLKSVQLGNVKLNDQRFGVLNLSSIRKTFHFSHLDGIVGLEFLRANLVRIDFDRQQVVLQDRNLKLQNNPQTFKFEWVNDKPLIDGKIDGQPAKILLDTGDRSNLTLFRKFAASSKLDRKFKNRSEIITGLGIAGPIRGRLTSIEEIELGSHGLHDVLVRLPMTKKGYFFSPKISASAGIGLLKAFNLEFDAEHQLVRLEERKNFQEESTFTPVVLPGRLKR